jgi:hypothetical protein
MKFPRDICVSRENVRLGNSLLSLAGEAPAL